MGRGVDIPIDFNAHGILNSLPMVYRPPYPWYIDPPTNGISNKIGYNCFIIFQDYLNIKILKYDENFEIL